MFKKSLVLILCLTALACGKEDSKDSVSAENPKVKTEVNKKSKFITLHQSINNVDACKQFEAVKIQVKHIARVFPNNNKGCGSYIEIVGNQYWRNIQETPEQVYTLIQQADSE